VATTHVELEYAPRRPFVGLHTRAQRWAVVVAHRRAGKTVACVNELIKAALLAGEGARFAYVAPFLRQAKAVAWDYLKRFARPIPGLAINEAELRIDFPNGARIQLFGADNADALRGLGFDGLVADEFGDWKPSVWGYVIRPALADRSGWAIIIGTPKGKNAFWETYRRAQGSDWYVSLITADTSGLLPQSELDALREELNDDEWRQEMLCDFDAAIPGAIFGHELWELEQAVRVKAELYDPALPVHAALDLGYSDDTAIWWFQVHKEIRLIECYSASGMPIAHYHEVLKAKPYKYGEWLWLPHDARAKSLQTGRSIEEQFRALGWKPRIVPELGLIDGIQAARLTLKTAWFDAQCSEGLDALKQYQREYDEDKKAFRDRPRHDWTSHYADAFRYACLVWKAEKEKAPQPPPRWPAGMTINELIQKQTRKRLEDA
jgi:phage terminase large subunit